MTRTPAARQVPVSGSEAIPTAHQMLTDLIAERDTLLAENTRLRAIIARYLRTAEPGASGRKDDLANIDIDARAALKAAP